MGRTGVPIGSRMRPCMTELGLFLRSQRLKAGMGQIAVAKRLGIRQVTYSAIETGKTGTVSRQYAKILAKVFSCQVSEILIHLPDRSPKTKLGRLIFLLRTRKKLTRQGLAVESGFKLGFVSALERGRTESFPCRRLIPLAQALGVPPSRLSGFVRLGTKRNHSPLGRMIRQLRAEAGINQKTLAGLLGISRQRMSQIESEGLSFRSSADRLLIRIATALEVDPEVLYNKSLSIRMRIGKRRKTLREPPSQIQNEVPFQAE